MNLEKLIWQKNSKFRAPEIAKNVIFGNFRGSDFGFLVNLCLESLSQHKFVKIWNFLTDFFSVKSTVSTEKVNFK